ncbi:MAG: 50S ribosomal protein L29 [Candidatus Limnocylindria bacterium]
MDISEIRALSDTDLESELRDAKQELWKIRFDLATRQEKNYSRLPATRRRIARILTVMTERRHAAEAALAASGASTASATAAATPDTRKAKAS